MDASIRKRKKVIVLVFAALLLIVVCVGISLLTSRWVAHQTERSHKPTQGHQWLHEELELSDQEIQAMDSFETDYRARRKELTALFDQRITELREILLANDRFSPEVRNAIHRLHTIHGELQELSIRHYYNMLEVLPPAKREKLRKIATEALSEPE